MNDVFNVGFTTRSNVALNLQMEKKNISCNIMIYGWCLPFENINVCLKRAYSN